MISLRSNDDDDDRERLGGRRRGRGQQQQQNQPKFYVLVGCVVAMTFLISNIVQTQYIWDGISGLETSSLQHPVVPADNDDYARTVGADSHHHDDDFELAKQQSFGFFDDISNKHWKELQKIHAESFPNHYSWSLKPYSNAPEDRNDIPKLRMSNWWNGENFQVEFHCPLTRRVPPTSQADGPKFVCDPHRLATKAETRRKDGTSDKCLIYSFGSNGKAEFEAGMKDIVGDACEIHTFDMVSGNNRFKNFTRELEGLSTFHNWGLGTSQQARTSPRRFKTLRQTMDALGHTGRTIDIFKIDCEWCEWFTHTEWFDDGNGKGQQQPIDIRQILVETHNAPMPHAKDFFYGLHDRGYVIFSKEANYQNGAGGVEFAFLKLSREFFETQEDQIHRSIHQHSRKPFSFPKIHQNKTHYFYGDTDAALAVPAARIT